MKFTCEIIKTLYGYNDDGNKVALQKGDEVYLKLDLEHMNLFDKEKWIQKYPDGWVGGVICDISSSGRKIKFETQPCTYLSLVQKDIIAVSDVAPNGNKRKTMWVCDHCLMGIESREGNQATMMHSVDEDDEIESKCDWCEDTGFDTLYELI